MSVSGAVFMGCVMELDRCKQTIDLEDWLMENKAKENYLITATYKSGRTEEFRGKLLKGETLPKLLLKKINNLRAFPTVTDVTIEKY